MFTGSRKNAYEAKDESSDNLDRLSMRFSNDLRGQVRRIINLKIFSKEWLALTDEIENLSKIAAMEHQADQINLTSNQLDNMANSSTTFTPKKKTGSSLVISSLRPSQKMNIHSVNQDTIMKSKPKGTLWDREEYCVRYIVEETKLSVLVHYMSDFKEIQKQITDGKLDLKKIASQLNLDENKLENKMVQFEESLGVLLQYCFIPEESLQTCDLYYLIGYIASCLHNSLDSSFTLQPPTRPFNKTQEFLVCEYLKSIVEKLDQLQEQTICSRLEEKDIIPSLISFLDKFHSFLSPEEQFVVCEVLAIFMDSESFQTNRDKYLKTDETKKLLISLNTKFIVNLMSSYERKKALLPLSNVITRLKITHG